MSGFPVIIQSNPWFSSLNSPLTKKELHVLLLIACPEVHDGDQAGVPVIVDVQAEAGGYIAWCGWQLVSHFSIFLQISLVRLIVLELVSGEAPGRVGGQEEG